MPHRDSKPSQTFGETVQKPAQEPIDAPRLRKPDPHLPKSARALNRWLSERSEKGRKGLVNILNETQVVQFGPLKLKGNITLIHEDGTLERANQLTLCRCGHSRNKPFCDDQHIDKEFMDPGRFAAGSEAPVPMRPVPVAVTCVENGPLQFDGRMRIVDYLGQQCSKTRGNLCRCGHSANKPFCDGSHKRVRFSSKNPGH
ncbi:MAG: CDGSH iron-sulfur domain-containing protein [Xanthomonadales bacterium]|nr:CDGSH iron-sulfur domain-containing protein [Xanthomonadales bacterium]